MRGQPATRDALLDLLRAWAITHVILFHVLHGLLRFAPAVDVPRIVADYPWWMNFSWQPLGVDVIFVVSSYLLTASLLTEISEKERIDIRAFLVRRVSRILPLYYIAVVLFALGQGNSLTDTVLALLFVEFLLTGSAIVPVGWTMELMIYVYLALPAIAYGIMRARRPFLWLGLAIGASLAIRLIPLWGKPEVATTLFTHLLERDGVLAEATALYFAPWFRLTPFLVGITLAAIVHLRPMWIAAMIRSEGRRIALRLGAVGLIAVTLFLPVHQADSWLYAAAGPAFWTGYWATNGGVFAIAVALLIVAQRGRPLHLRGPWQMISRNIMGVYLFHMPMILIGAVAVFRSTERAILGTATVWHVLGIFAVAFVLTLGVAALLNRFVEDPMQRWLRRKFNV